MLDEVAEELELEAGELDRGAAAQHHGAAEVGVHGAEDHGVGARRGGAGAAEQRLDARQQLAHVERLGQVVVGAELEADDAVDDLPARGQHQQRRLHAASAEVAADVEAVLARQRDVEDQQIELRPRAHFHGRVAVEGDVDVVAFALQTVAQRDHEAVLILDEEDAPAQLRHAAPRGYEE